MSNARDKANIPALNFSSTGIDDNATSTAVTIDSLERVGIGTASPTSLLTVEGTSVIADFKSTNNNNVIRIKGNNATTGVAIGSTSSDDFIFTTNISERMRIQNSTGNVGIGTSSPSNVLHIKNSNPTIRLEDSDGSSSIYGQIQSNASGDILIRADNDNAGASSKIRLQVDGSEKVRIDSSGNVGIGNTVASTINSANGTGNLVVGSGSGTEGITIYSGTTGEGTLQFADATTGVGTYVGQINYNHSSNFMSFGANGAERMRLDSAGELIMRTGNKFVANRADNTRTISLYCNNTAGYLETDNDPITLNSASRIGFEFQGTERMRLDASGNLLVGTTSQVFAGKMNLAYSRTTHDGFGINCDSTNIGIAIKFKNPNGAVGQISTSGSATTYSTSSDYRLKENVNYNFDATTRLKQLKPARFNFIADADTTVDGFLAHEVQDVVPEAITGTKDEVDADGNPEYQGIDQSKLVPLLVKTIQELEARITVLETNNP